MTSETAAADRSGSRIEGRADGRRFLAPMAGALVVAIGYRLLVLTQLRAHPELLEPVLDGAAHLAWARGLLDGTWPGPEPFFRAPGYVAVLAGLLGVGSSAAGAVTVQLLAGAVTASLTARLAGALFGNGAAWVAGLGAALYPTFPFFELQLLAPVAAVPLFLIASLATLAADERPSTGRCVAAGLAWGVVGAVRPPLLAGAVVLGALMLLRPGRSRRQIALVIAATLLVPLLLTARNAAVGDPAFIASQGGLNFYLGNGKEADGYAATFPDAPAALGYRMMEAATAIAEREEGRPLRPTEVSRFWSRRALRDIADAPGRWAGLLVAKAVLFTGAREIPNNHDPVLVARILPGLRLPGWGLWWPLAGLGAWLGWRRRPVRVTVALVGAVALGCVFFFVNARFRVPAAPLVIALGAGGVVELVRRGLAGGGERRALVWAGSLAAGLALVSWSNPYGLPREPWVSSYVLLAEAERNRGEPVRSLRWIEQALEVEPGLYTARLAQVELLRRMARVSEAEAVVDRLLEARPGDPALLTEKAILLDLGGRPEEALAVMDRVLALDPSPGARISRAVMLARVGRADEARAELERILRERAGHPEAARAARVLGELEAVTGP